MPSRKKLSGRKAKDSTIVLDEANPWLVAVQSLYGGLQDGEITLRTFQKLAKISTLNSAKNVMNKLIESGKAENVGKKVVEQDGKRPSKVNVYRLTDK